MPNSLEIRREAVARVWDLSAAAVLVPAGTPIPIAGTDQVHEFHAHPEFSYLAGVRSAGSVLAFDPAEGWELFAPVATQDQRVWEGDGADLVDAAARAGLTRVLPRERLRDWLERRRALPIALIGNHDLKRSPAAYGIESFASLELEFDDGLAARLSELVSEARRAKDATEVVRMRAAADSSKQGHLAGLQLARAGMTERDLQVEIEAEFFRNGAARTAYGSIVGSGPNSAILHIAPTQRALRDGDMVLVDAGAEFEGYASDVTRTFPVGRAFTGIQKDIYELVLDAQEEAIAGVRPGVEYKDLHLGAAERIAGGLADLGILHGNAADLVEQDAHALFFVHGLGHMLGLATHDAGGCLAGRQPSDRFGLKWLRADLPLEAGYVVTVEPGVYFIDALLADPELRDRYRDAVNWERVDSMRGFGGVRIEDDVLVTPSGADVLSGAIPKSVAEIEAIRGEALSS